MCTKRDIVIFILVVMKYFGRMKDDFGVIVKV